MSKRRTLGARARRLRAEARPRRQEQRRLSTRRELLQAGRALFGAQGIYEPRIEDITHQAGIAKGTLYLHFRDKEDLLQAVTRDGLAELQAFVRDAVGDARAPEELLAAVLGAHLDFFRRHPDLQRILHQVRGALKFDQPAWRPLRGLLRAHVELLARELGRAGAAAGTPARRRALAALAFGIASGSASVRAALYPDATELAQLEARAAGPLARALLESVARERGR